MLAATTAPHLYWIASRAAGTAALLLSSASVGIGVTMGGRLVRGRGPDLRVTHEALSLAAIAALAIHGATLLGDGFLNLGLADVTIPFAGSYRTFWTTLGIVGGWGIALLGLSYYARGRIGVQRWRRLHRWVLLFWGLGLVHSLGEGTDAGLPWFLLSVGAVVLPAAALVLARYASAHQAAAR